MTHHIPTPHSRRRAPIAAALTLVSAVALTLAACGGDSGTGPGGSSARAVAVVSGDSQSVAAGVVTAPLVVRVNDGSGSPVSGAVVKWALTKGILTLSDTSTTTNASGQTQITVTAGTQAGTSIVRAALTDSTTLVNFTVIVKAGAAAQLAKVGFDSPAAVKGSGVPVTVKVADKYGNGVAGVTVTWSTSAGTLSAAAGATDANGFATTTLTTSAAAAAVYKVTASSPGLSSITFTITTI